jgi:hypothetical protein
VTATVNCCPTVGLPGENDIASSPEQMPGGVADAVAVEVARSGVADGGRVDGGGVAVGRPIAAPGVAVAVIVAVAASVGVDDSVGTFVSVGVGVSVQVSVGFADAVAAAAALVGVDATGNDTVGVTPAKSANSTVTVRLLSAGWSFDSNHAVRPSIMV